MSDKEFRQKMAEIYLRYAGRVLDTADGIREKIKPMVEEMSDCYSTAKRLIEAADRLKNETY
uniref:hypothetical protein n=1 Tax=Gemmiger formicilis TaxID=745368 RepID=UPI00402518EA